MSSDKVSTSPLSVVYWHNRNISNIGKIKQLAQHLNKAQEKNHTGRVSYPFIVDYPIRSAPSNISFPHSFHTLGALECKGNLSNQVSTLLSLLWDNRVKCFVCLFVFSQVLTYHYTQTVWIWILGTMENRDALPSSGLQGYWMSKNTNA